MGKCTQDCVQIACTLWRLMVLYHTLSQAQVLAHTMGSPYAFEYRRQELQNTGLPHSDAAVADSFRTVAAPEGPGGQEGLVLRYLTLAEVAVVVNDILFTHGAIQDLNMGWVRLRCALRCSSLPELLPAVRPRSQVRAVPKRQSRDKEGGRQDGYSRGQGIHRG